MKKFIIALLALFSIVGAQAINYRNAPTSYAYYILFKNNNSITWNVTTSCSWPRLGGGLKPDEGEQVESGYYFKLRPCESHMEKGEDGNFHKVYDEICLYDYATNKTEAHWQRDGDFNVLRDLIEQSGNSYNEYYYNYEHCGLWNMGIYIKASDVKMIKKLN